MGQISYFKVAGVDRRDLLYMQRGYVFIVAGVEELIRLAPQRVMGDKVS